MGLCAGAMRYIVAIGELVRHKPLRLVAVSLPNWKPMCTSGADVQMLTWLGPLMSASVCPGRVSDPETGPFKDVEKPQVTPDIQSTFNQIRGQTEAHNRTMHSIVLTLLSSKESKPRVLMWIEAAIRLNGDRQKMQVRRLCYTLSAYPSPGRFISLQPTEPCFVLFVCMTTRHFVESNAGRTGRQNGR
jgi:hypothetical protein